MLGYHDMSASYIHFLLLKLTGIDFSRDLVDTVTVIVFFSAFAISAFLNARKWKQDKMVQKEKDPSNN